VEFAKKFIRSDIMALKLILFMAVIFLTAQVVAGETTALRTEESVQGGQPAPNKAKLSKRNQAMIEQAEAAITKNEMIKAKQTKSKLSKRNRAMIEQEQAAKRKQELIEKRNATSTKK
jgi:long-subunit fatty acid transport protein